MQKKLLLVPVVAICLGLLLSVGCDDDSSLDNQSIRIDPQSVTLGKVDTTIALTVAGGHAPFEWTVSDDTLGTVGSDSRTVTYTRTDVNGANTVTVTDNQTWTAQAVIIQQDEADVLAISPTDITLDGNGDKVAFTGTGGTYPYTWTVGIAARGHVDSATGSQTVYTRDTAEDNTVLLTDKKGHVAIANITQPDVASLSVSPSTASVATNGGTQVFTAVGGTAPYTWSFAVNNSGAPNPSPVIGSSTLYVSGGAGIDTIRVIDGDGTLAFATITKN